MLTYEQILKGEVSQYSCARLVCIGSHFHPKNHKMKLQFENILPDTLYYLGIMINIVK